MAILAAFAGLAAACGHYASPVRPPALSPDVGPVYNAGQPPETAAERRAQRERERQRMQRPQLPVPVPPPSSTPAPPPSSTPAPSPATPTP